MAARTRLICQADEVIEGGKGVRFTVQYEGEATPAFVVRYDGQVFGYLNRCAHIPVEMDWAEGEFFDYTGLHLVCATHGATYLPHTGQCIAGPCKGRRLVAITVEEDQGQVWLKE